LLIKSFLKNPEWRSKTKKDPGIPNLFPYKDKILHEIEEKRRLKEEENARRRELARQQQPGGEAAMDTLDDGEEELEEPEELLDGESGDEDSMQVVGVLPEEWLDGWTD